MRLSCGIVMDLLPLYEEGICSEETKKAVEEHLKECKKCRSFLEDVHSFPEEEMQSENIVKSQLDADKVVVKSFKKIRLRWAYSLMLIVALIPVCILGYHQLTGQGIGFTNLREFYIGQNFVKQLQLGDYEKAFQYLNLEDKKTEYDFMTEEQLENFEETALEVFLKSAEQLESVGGIQGFQYKGINDNEYDNRVDYTLTYVLVVDGEGYFVDFRISDKGVASFGTRNSFKKDPITYFGMWSEWLWEDLNNCYLDFETNDYVYY